MPVPVLLESSRVGCAHDAFRSRASNGGGHPLTLMIQSLLEFTITWWPTVIAFVGFAIASTATVDAVLRKRDSRAVISWVGLIWLAPFLGTLAYVLLGINRIERKAYRIGLREVRRGTPVPTLLDEDTVHEEDVARFHPTLRGLSQLVGRVTARELIPGNRVEHLINGDETYPQMLAAIDEAQHSVALLSYIFDSDRAGDAFFESLVRAHQRGVEVRVLIDAVGSRYSRVNMISRLQSAGVPACSFLPTRTPRLFKYANLRNHRKLLITDGRLGFTGGTNIREGHCLELDAIHPVQCLHFRVEGPVVAQLQEAFVIDWAFAARETLTGDLWFPEIPRAGTAWARGITDGPDEDFEKMQDAMLGALATASHSVHIVTPYFLPEAALIAALNTTAMRGVEVRILLPRDNNVLLVQWACAGQLDMLLDKDCRVFYSPPPFDHTKLLIVDGIWTLLGSTNWDPRSLRLNFEFNIECYDRELAGKLTDLVEAKIAGADEVTRQQLASRSLPVRLRDGLARLATPYL